MTTNILGPGGNRGPGHRGVGKHMTHDGRTTDRKKMTPEEVNALKMTPEEVTKSHSVS